MDKGKYDYCAVSSRVRLARNLENYPFGTAYVANSEIVDLVTRTLKPLGDFTLIKMNELGDGQAGYLKEKYIISPYLYENLSTGAVLLSADESISVMINEEDHLREQCFLEGLCPEKAYENLKYLDRKLSERMRFARDKEFGYITACLSNIGTGMRASVMMFLPMLTESGRINELIGEIKDLGLTVRGSFGEGSKSEGCFYQISNEVTLGYSETEILQMVTFFAKKLCDMEYQERNRAQLENPLGTEDACRRAYGILTNCKILSYEEFAELFIKVALGAYYGYYDLSPSRLYKLFVNMRPNILSFMEDADNAEKRDILRAEIVSSVLQKRG